MMGAKTRQAQRRGFALIITLMLVVLLATTAAQLATVTSVEALRVSRTANTLTHELAVDSVLVVAAERLRHHSITIDDLDHNGHHTFDLALGECQIRCRIADDGAKFDVAAFAHDGQKHLLRRKLQTLARSVGLTQTRIRLRPLATDGRRPARRYVWFDQFLDDPDPSALFDWPRDEAHVVWSDAVTCFGSGRVDMRRAPREVLTALFDDVDRSIARKIVTARAASRPDGLQELLRELHTDVRDEVQSRIAFGLNRYAFNIETAINADRRRWYVVVTVGDETIDVHYRGQIQW